MEYLSDIAQALHHYKWATRAMKALKVAQVAAMGCAAASLIVGGVRVIKRFREE